jgi:hypothetical protein
MLRGSAFVLGIIVVAALAASLAVSWRRHGHARLLQAELATAVEHGSLADLERAQVIARRLTLGDPDDAEAAATLAFVSALLSVDYGLDTVREAEAASARALAARRTGDGPRAMAGAAGALAALRRGARERALEQATAAASADVDLPHPLYALARVRALNGDLVGASRALEAAMVASPGFGAAKVAWAEVRIDLGDASTAVAALEPVVARAPSDLHARLLLEEARRASDEPPRDDPELAAACRAGARGAAAGTAPSGCALAAALRARLAGQRASAREQALAAARAAPDEPRLLARVAELLAAVGAVDGDDRQADALLARATRFAAPSHPALAWARLAITLARGHAEAPPPGLPPDGPEAWLLDARAALALGGAHALAAALDRAGAATVARDPELALLARVGGAPVRDQRAAAALPPDDPGRAYVEGLLARLHGDLPRAAERLGRALSAHGDACRAAGEYVATLRALGRRPDPAIFAPLRAENAHCINLPRHHTSPARERSAP